MIEFLKYIYETLSSVGVNVYQNSVPEIDPETNLPPAFPYVVFKTPNSTPNEYRDDIIIEVDIWDNVTDTTRIETITSNIDSILNREKYISQNFHTSLYRINRLSIPDPDESIKHRQLRYKCQTWFVNNGGIL